MPEIVFDCCVLSNFALSGALPILKTLYAGKGYITNFVSAEILRGIQRGYGDLTTIKSAIKDGWLKETVLSSTEEKAVFEALSVSLGFGETSSIGIAKTRGLLFACDDKAARREASLLIVKLTGTIGILAKAVKSKIIDINAADRHLKKMIAFGFYSPIASLKEILF